MSEKRVDTFLEFKDIYLLLPFLAYSLIVDLLTPFVGAKMTELKNWSKSLIAKYGFWKNLRNGPLPFTRVTNFPLSKPFV